MEAYRPIGRRLLRATALVAPLQLAATAAVCAQPPPLVHEGVVCGPVEKVWAAFTTPEGLQSWMVPHAEFDLRIGGKMRTNYNKDGVLGDSGTIENTILAFEPQRMLTLKATKPPERFPYKRALESMWTVLYFEPVAPDRTRLRIVGLGFTDDEESQNMRKHFDAGNAWTLKKLQGAFAPPATQPSAGALELARRLVGGEWYHESRGSDGGVFRARNVFDSGPDGKCVTGRGWLGNADRLVYHGHTQVWPEPGTQRLMFQNINEHGTLARGEVRAIGPDVLEWDWNAQSSGGSVTMYRVHMRFEDPDHYRMELLRWEDGAWVSRFELPFHRKAVSPAHAASAAPSGGDRR